MRVHFNLKIQIFMIVTKLIEWYHGIDLDALEDLASRVLSQYAGRAEQNPVSE